MALRLTRWDPFRGLLSMPDDCTRLFRHAFGEEPGVAWAPPMDIVENADGFKIVAELPGFGPEDVDVTVSEGTLTIKGERKFYEDVDEKNLHRVERRFGSFQRTISLPSQVQEDKISATFDKGVLTLEIPKAEESKPRRVEIKARG